MEDFDDYPHRVITYNYCESLLAMEEKKVVLTTLPVQVHLAVSSICNKSPRCAMCLTEHKGEFMPEDLLDKVIAEVFPTAADIILTADGEPSIYPFLGKIGGNVINSISMQTNGLCSDGYLDVIHKLHNIYFSVDAATEDTYKIIRGSGFSTVLDNIHKILSLSIAMSRDVFVRMDFVLMQCNKHEAVQFIELAHSMGVNGVKMNPLFPLSSFPKPEIRNGYIFDYSKELIYGSEAEEYIGAARKKAEELGIAFEGYNYVLN